MFVHVVTKATNNVTHDTIRTTRWSNGTFRGSIFCNIFAQKLVQIKRRYAPNRCRSHDSVLAAP